MRMKSALQRIFHYGGGLQLVRWGNAPRNRVLTYHTLSPSGAGAFGQQCEHLRRCYSPVTLDDVAGFVRDGKALPHNSIAITVDDGYRDFYLHAYPVLRRHSIPATVFLVTDFLDRRGWLWWDQLH